MKHRRKIKVKFQPTMHVEDTSKDRGQAPVYVWWFVGFLVALCAIIFIIQNIRVK